MSTKPENYKPKKLVTAVPGMGNITREEFGPKHLKAVLKQIKAAGLDEAEYLRNRYDIISFNDLPLFSDDEEEEEARLMAEAKAKEAEEEAKLLAQLEAEQKLKDEEAAKAAGQK